MRLAATVQNRVSAGNQPRKETDTGLEVDFRRICHHCREVSGNTFEEKKNHDAAGEVDTPHYDPNGCFREEGKKHHDSTQTLKETTQHKETAKRYT